MSAYIVDREHIRYLVAAGVSGPEPLYYYHDGKGIKILADDHDGLTKLGQMLWDENIKSIRGRYPDCQKSLNNAPGPTGENFIYSHITQRGNFDPVQVIKAAKCYGYQSCEHGEWETSAANAYIDALIDRMIRRLPGYNAANWGPPRKPTQWTRQGVFDTADDE